MKTLKCDACEEKFTADTFAAWVELMKPHYKNTHSDLMEQSAHLPQEEQMKKMQDWMKDAEMRFKNA